ncbi:MAG: hypothetical protein QNI84_15910 [Henriciella sp.]|nr:hypothetical protein [Henriciella sp.]
MTDPLERDSSGRFVKPPEQTPNMPTGADDVHPVGRLLFGWVENKRTPSILLGLVVLVIIGLTVADLLVDRHDYFDFANTVWFYSLWGFGAFALAVLSGWPLGHLLRRDEDYYGEAETRPDDVEADE